MSRGYYTEGESTPGYGLGFRQPTGMGMDGYEPGRFTTTPPPVAWCDEAGCPQSECVQCKAAKR